MSKYGDKDSKSEKPTDDEVEKTKADQVKQDAAKDEYPRWVHHKTLPSKVINSPDEREAGWTDTPSPDTGAAVDTAVIGQKPK